MDRLWYSLYSIMVVGTQYRVTDAPRKSGQVFQRLPRHMQRRAMSHNSKRLPRRLRDAYNQQLEKCGASQKKKRPSRKFRRRPRNLLEVYNRRQRAHVWLETHIWHAKRFHMVERWGYKLPLRPTDKSFRACYRAVAHHCLLQDVSYYCCIELSGPVDTLLSALKHHTSTDCGPTFAAQSCLKGTREGSVMFFQRDAYPYRFVGPVSFTWCPQETDHKTLWLWAHPAFYKEILQELTTTFDLQPDESSDALMETSTIAFSSSVEQLKLAPRNVPFLLVPRLRSGDGKVHVALLKDTLSRLRLTGPLSQAVLTQALAVTGDRTAAWCTLKCCASPAEMPPHVVVGVTLCDPRLHLPPKRTKAVPQCGDQQLMEELPPDWATGDIWSAHARNEAIAHKLSSAAVAELCGQRLVPQGPVLGTEEVDQHTFPAQLLHRPGNMRTGKRLELLAPDSSAGHDEARRLESELSEQHFRKPPSKRPNFVKLGMSSPFVCRWDILVREWCGQDCNWFVWRARKVDNSAPGECLVPVTINSVGRGFPTCCALICVPHKDDTEDGVLEPVHVDEGQAARREMRKEHKARLRRERKLRKRGVDSERPSNPDYPTADRNAWLPEAMAIKDSSSRTVIGYVTAGDYCFSEAQGVGQGYIVLQGLRFLQSKNVSDMVTYRNPTSRQYRLGKLSYPRAFAT
ncbi:hypothetical protein PR048_022566 [Dryococelus australis]|uniref:Uncharacterized protein n=1 Tax=Dryococelus australis TaxID=614101 RepID=A0ABQ9H1B4_9NEOP|nr:hypothetical protein PR048_022566 [Dryococelus australis]